MKKFLLLIGITATAVLSLGSCVSLAPRPIGAELILSSPEVEVGGKIGLSLRLAMPGGLPRISWTANSGELQPTAVANEIDLIAPAFPGEITVTAAAQAGGASLERSARIAVLPRGALKKTATILLEVDCASLKGVWVDASHPAENFAPPLRVKGTFRMDEDTGEAFAGGSWPLYAMYDDGSHGDRAAGDGIWSLRFEFEKTDSKVYFAFDDANVYRAGFESGLAYRLKLAWRGVDTAGEVSDANNLFFVPDRDQVVAWTAEMAAGSGIYAALKE